MEYMKIDLPHDKFRLFLKEKLSKSYDFFDLDFRKFAYFANCKNVNKSLGMKKDRFKKIVDHVFSDRTKKQTKHINDFLNSLKLFFANLVAKDGELIISLRMQDYLVGEIYNKIISYVYIKKIVKAMSELGYIEVEKGRYWKKNTIVYATKKFWEEFGELENLKLQLRQSSRVTGYAEERGEKFHKIACTIENQENTLAKHEVTLSFTDNRIRSTYGNDYEENKSLGETMFRRMFQGKNKGGRFYARGKGSVYQRMPSELRKCLMIDNENTSEIDFKCEHLNILYATEGIDMWNIMDDAYSIDGVNKEYRFVVKVALLVMLNCKNEDHLFNIIFNHFKKDKAKWRRDIFFDKFLKEYSTKEQFNEFISNIKKKHQFISKYFCSGVGLLLQRKDSDIMAEILDKCLENDIIALPVHDSVIVKKKHSSKVKQIMKNAFKNVIGFDAKVEE